MNKRMSDLIDAYRAAVSDRVAFNSPQHRAAETAAREALLGQTQAATVADLRQTVSDEWGSHVCYRDPVTGFNRLCDKDRKCRCADIARAILATYSVQRLPQVTVAEVDHG